MITLITTAGTLTLADDGTPLSWPADWQTAEGLSAAAHMAARAAERLSQGPEPGSVHDAAAYAAAVAPGLPWHDEVIGMAALDDPLVFVHVAPRCVSIHVGLDDHTAFPERGTDGGWSVVEAREQLERLAKRLSRSKNRDRAAAGRAVLAGIGDATH